MRAAASALAWGAALYLALALALMLLQRSLIYHPQPRLLGAQGQVESLVVPPSPGVPGATLQLSVRPHAGDKALIYFGGNAEDVSLNLPSFERAFADHAIYLLHYRGYGASTGRPSEAALHADALALFDHVRARHAQVALIGRSLGSGVAIHLATRRPATHLVLVTPYDSLLDVAAAAMPWLPVRWMLFDRFESGRDAPLIKVPTLILAAERDEVIAPASTALLVSRFGPGIATHQVVAGAGHNDLDRDPAYWRAMKVALGAAN